MMQRVGGPPPVIPAQEARNRPVDELFRLSHGLDERQTAGKRGGNGRTGRAAGAVSAHALDKGRAERGYSAARQNEKIGGVRFPKVSAFDQKCTTETCGEFTA